MYILLFEIIAELATRFREVVRNRDVAKNVLDADAIVSKGGRRKKTSRMTFGIRLRLLSKIKGRRLRLQREEEEED